MYFILEKHLEKEASCLGCFIFPQGQGSEYKYDLEEIKEITSGDALL